MQAILDDDYDLPPLIHAHYAKDSRNEKYSCIKGSSPRRIIIRTRVERSPKTSPTNSNPTSPRSDIPSAADVICKYQSILTSNERFRVQHV